MKTRKAKLIDNPTDERFTPQMRASLGSVLSPEQAQSSVTWVLLSAIVQVSIGVFLFGYNISLFNVPATVIRENATEKHFLNDFEWEIVNAMFPFGAGIGALFTGVLADRYGRRSFLLFNAVICIIGSVVTTFCYSYVQLLIGRCITGIASGASTGVSSVYLNEISPVNLRGVIGTSIQLVLTLAIVISELLGKVWLINTWYWRIGCIIPAILSLIQLIVASLTLPRSPQWLVTHGQRQFAVSELTHLRGSPQIARYELREYLPPIKESQSISINSANSDNNERTIQGQESDNALLIGNHKHKHFEFDNEIGLCTAVSTYPVIGKVLLISIFVHVLQQLSGINVVFYYSTDILESVGVSNAYLGSVLIATANFFSVILATFLIDKQGRRPLFLVSCMGMVISSVLLTVMFIGINSDGGSIFGIGAIACLILYVVTFEIGLGPIPWMFVAEITPIEYRGSITSISQMVNYGCNTLIALTSTSILQSLGNYGFLPFGVVCFIGCIVVYKFVPETKKKSVDQILSEL